MAPATASAKPRSVAIESLPASNEPRTEVPRCILEAAEAAWASLEARDSADAAGSLRRRWTVDDVQFELTVGRRTTPRSRVVGQFVSAVGVAFAVVNGTHGLDATAARSHAARITTASTEYDAMLRSGDWQL